MNPNFFWIVADVLVKVTAVLLAGGILALTMGGATAARRHLVWLLTCSAALAMPALCAVLPAWRALPAGASAEGRQSIVRDWLPAKGELIPGPVGDGGDSRRSGTLRSAGASKVGISLVAEPKTSPQNALPTVWTSIAAPKPSRAKNTLAMELSLIWSAGCALLLARLVVSSLLLRRLWKDAAPVTVGSMANLFTAALADLNVARRVQLRTSARQAMPMTWGILRPVVLLPAAVTDWPAGRVRLAMLHELAHVKRWDSLAQLIGQLCCAVYWFHPLAWLPAAGLRREQERAADDRVLLLDSHDTDYASFLLELAAGQGSRWVGGNAGIAMARPTAMEGRLRAILDVGRQRNALSRRSAWGAVAVAFALVVPVAALRGQAQAPQATLTPTSQPAGGGERYTGHVLSPDGKPVAEAEVFLRGFANDGAMVVLANSKADTDGAFVLTASALLEKQSAHWIEAWGAGYGPVSLRTSESHDYLVRLAEPSSLRLTFVGPDGQPVEGLRVRPERSTRNFLLGMSPPSLPQQLYYTQTLSDRFTRTTDVQGSCVFELLPRVSLISFQIDDERFAQLPSMPDVQIGSGPQSAPVTIQLKPAGSISGKVTYHTTGEPAGGIHITAFDRKNNAYFGSGGKIVTNERGEYRIPQVREGNYQIRASGFGGAWTARIRNDVTVPVGRMVSAQDIELVGGTVVHGRVFESQTGKPFADAIVSDTDLDANENQASAKTDADGRFVMRVPPGRQGIYLGSQPPEGLSSEEFDGRGHRLRNANGSFSGGYGPAAHYDINAVDGEEVSIELRLLPKPGKPVTGHVVDADGKPVPNISVRAISPEDDDVMLSGTSNHTDAAGRFQFRALMPGTKLSVTSDKAGVLSPVVVQGGEGGVVIQLARNVRTTVSGTVVNSTGKPIADAGIYVMVIWGASGLSGSGPASLTDADGHFTLSNLLPDARYSLTISAAGYVSRYVDLKFTPGEENSDAGKIVMQTLASGR